MRIQRGSDVIRREMDRRMARRKPRMGFKTTRRKEEGMYRVGKNTRKRWKREREGGKQRFHPPRPGRDGRS